MLTAVLILLVVFLASIVLAWRHRNGNKNEPPSLPGALPLLGHIHLLPGNSTQLWNTAKKLCYDSLDAGGVASLHIGPKTTYFVTDPEDCLTIANTCLQKDGYYDFGKPWFGDGLITAHVSIWKEHRKLLTPAFNQSVLDGFIDVFNSQARRLVRDLETEVDKGPFDHSTYILSNVLETLCQVVMAVEFDKQSLLNKEYVHAAENIFKYLIERFQKPWLHSDVMYNWSSLKRKQDECLKIVHNMSNTVLKKRKAEYMNNKHNGGIESTTKGDLRKIKVYTEKKLYKCSNLFTSTHRAGSILSTSQDLAIVHHAALVIFGLEDFTHLREYYEELLGPKFRPFMDLILELAIEKGAFNDRQVREHVDTILFAGHDTSATILMFTMLMVGSYPEVQEKIFEELHNIFEDDDRDVTKQDLSQLVYLEAVLNETMRHYPVAPLIIRYLDQDIKLRNCTLSKGRTCFLSVYGVHRHSTWGTDVEEFKPERWLDSETLPKCATAFSGFGMGRRMCIGKIYAMMSMKTTLAHIFRRYRMSGNHSMMVAKLDVLLKPVSGHHVTITMRKDKK